MPPIIPPPKGPPPPRKPKPEKSQSAAHSQRGKEQTDVKPDLSHYHGRGVESVSQGDEPGEWFITLEGGVVITNKDPNIAFPDTDLPGKVLLTTIFSELDTRLKFGLTNAQAQSVNYSHEIVLNPLEYTIGDPTYSGVEPVYPQVPDEDDEVPPEPSHKPAAVTNEADEGEDG